MRHLAVLALLTCVVSACNGGQGEPGRWQELTESIDASEARIGRGAMEVQRDTGDVYILGKTGVYRSSDGGKTWELFSAEHVVGAYWYAASLTLDPEGKGRLAAFMKDPPEKPYASAMTLDGGKSWQEITRVKMDRKLHSYGWSWGLVDWSQEKPTFLLGRMHHSSRIWQSRDAGKTWNELPVGSRYMGMMDASNLVVWNERTGQAYHSADGGKTWQETARLEVTAYLAASWKGKLYWVVQNGVVVSSDGGRTWKQLPGKLDKLYWGPVLGKTEKDMIVAGLEGVYRSRDGGVSWDRIAENHAVKIKKGFGEEKFKMDWFIGETDFAWDIHRNRLYLSVPGKLFFLELEE